MSRKTVLVIEDHPGDRDIYGKILWYNGYHLVFAEDGEAGLRLARERHPDLILLDLELPLLHGLEICSRLKQEDATKDIPIVALTARRLREFGGNAQVLGYAHFLEKPVGPLHVLRVVERLIGRSVGDQAEDAGPPEVVRTPPRDTTVTPPSSAPTAPARVADLRLLGEHLLEKVPDVLARWEQLGREEPWFALAPEDRIDNFPEIMKSLVQGALMSDQPREARTEIVNAAVEHGYARRMHGLAESIIPLEFHLLRQAVWRHLLDSFPPNDDLYAAIRALDEMITVAMNASMWGFFRDEIQSQGRWENALERLIGTSNAPAEGGG